MRPSHLSRFGFDGGGKPLVDRTTVQRGFRTTFPNGESVVGDVSYPASDCAEAVAAASAAEELEREQRLQFDRDAADVASGKQDFATVAERFTSKHRREQPMINSYNPIIQYCTRSNMDIRVLLRDSDARGAMFYILSYATKTESDMDALLNILAPVVERIKDESNGAPDKVVAAALVRSCSCKTIAHLRLGAPAAASKVLGYSDAKCSSEAVACPVWPLLREDADAFGKPAAPPASPADSDDEEKEGRDDNSDSDNENGDNVGGVDVFISGVTGKLRMSTLLHHLYLRRCDKDDTEHPYHGMSYVVWARRVRIEAAQRASKMASNTPARGVTDADMDEEPGGEDIEDCCDTGASAAAPARRVRKPSERHDFVGLPATLKQQVSGSSVFRF